MPDRTKLIERTRAAIAKSNPGDPGNELVIELLTVGLELVDNVASIAASLKIMADDVRERQIYGRKVVP